MPAMRQYLALAGFILFLYDGSGKPLNHPPYHVFSTQAECESDQEVWRHLLDPEWKSTCKPTKEQPAK